MWFEPCFYCTQPESSWECDLESMDRLVDARTRAIVINNPSNPCGSNFSAEHLAGIAAVARKHKLPIVADEIYAGCVFDGEFSPMHVHSGDVPVISVGGEFLRTSLSPATAACCTAV